MAGTLGYPVYDSSCELYSDDEGANQRVAHRAAHVGHEPYFAKGGFWVGKLGEYMQREDLLPSIRVTELLRAAFDGAPAVYEAYSEFDSSTKVFRDGDALTTHVSALRALGKKWFNFSFHFPETGGEVSTVRLALKPEKCDGATWRENTRGWGLIHIQITDQPDAMSKCSVSVNSEKRAHTWAETIKDQGDPRLWNWKAVDSQARRIIRVLRRLSS